MTESQRPCEHPHPEMVESYYSDTEWCPDCGAARGSDGKFGPGAKMLEWKLPKNAPAYKKRPIDTLNHFVVGASADEIAILLAPTKPFPKPLALNLAAYLVALADESEGHSDFYALLAAIESA